MPESQDKDTSTCEVQRTREYKKISGGGGGAEIFRTRPDRPWGPPILHSLYRVIPEGKRPGRGVNHPPPSSAEVKERVELYLCSSSEK
jgi:hypothetical protein